MSWIRANIWEFPPEVGIDATIESMHDGTWAWLRFHDEDPISISYDETTQRFVVQDDEVLDADERGRIEEWVNNHGLPPTSDADQRIFGPPFKPS